MDDRPDRPTVQLRQFEYLFYCAGVRFGHADAAADAADNSDRLAAWLFEEPRTRDQVDSMLAEHARAAREIAVQRREEAARFVDEAVAARPGARSVWARLLAALGAARRELLGP